MEQLIEILEFAKEHLGWVTVLLGGIIQISPIKVFPVNWLKKGLKWIGDQMTGELKEAIREIKADVKKLESDADQKRIKDLRYQILDFADAIRKRDFDRETYEHIIFDIHAEYEQLLAKYELTNGKVDRAMVRIAEKYDDLLKQNPDF